MDITRETLNEGRFALDALERRLKTGPSNRGDVMQEIQLEEDKKSIEGTTRNLPSTMKERKSMDKASRNARLNMRKGSPFGLTLGEMDDRGLLEGGATLPTQLLSIRQRGRRHQEMRRRSLRKQDRDQTDDKTFHNCFHMIRALIRRGLNVFAHFQGADVEQNGLVSQKTFIGLMQQLSLPYAPKELSALARRYTVLDEDGEGKAAEVPLCDYRSMLLDAGVSSQGEQDDPNRLVLDSGSFEGDGSLEVPLQDINVLSDVRAMVRDAVQRLGKSVEDVYRMFSRWDTGGTGFVTAPQLLRVLARLHVDLSDHDQDFLIELLDTESSGRIYFEGLVTFIFSDSPEVDFSELGTSHWRATSNSTSMGDAADGASLVPTLESGPGGSDGVGHMVGHSGGAGDGNSNRRPHTASSSRPRLNVATRQTAYDTKWDTAGASAGDASLPGAAVSPKSQSRPLTASARVLTSGYSRGDDRDMKGRGGGTENRYSSSSVGLDEVMDLPLDFVGDDGGGGMHVSGMASMPHSPVPHNVAVNMNVYSSTQVNVATSVGAVSSTRNALPTTEDERSYNDNTLLTAPDDEFVNSGAPVSPVRADQGGSVGPASAASGSVEGALFVGGAGSLDSPGTHSPLGFPRGEPTSRTHGGTGFAALSTIYSGDLTMDGGLGFNSHASPTRPLVHFHGAGGSLALQEEESIGAADPRAQGASESPAPVSHLELLASQTLDTLRDMVLGRRKEGKSFREIFLHFARSGPFFDTMDLATAMSDLRIQTSDKVAQLCVQGIARDGVNKVSFGEFMVFVTDSSHVELERRVQHRLAVLLENQGRDFQSLLYGDLWNFQQLNGQGQSGGEGARGGMVDTEAFKHALARLNLDLSEVDTNRLVTRFDIHGRGQCSVSRFLRMAQDSIPWQAAEKALAVQEEAIEEAQAAIMQLNQEAAASKDPGRSHRSPSSPSHSVGPATDVSVLPGLTKEVVRMAEYLGIKVLSEPHLMWIAVEAYNAPLPPGWTAHADNAGKTYFFHAASRASRWDHPLDPHFRRLRDKFRASSGDESLATSAVAATEAGGGKTSMNTGTRSRNGQGDNYGDRGGGSD